MQSVLNPGFLFWDRDHVWVPESAYYPAQMSKCVMLPSIMTTCGYRHIAIAVDRRLLHGEASKLYGVQEDFEQRSWLAGNLFSLDLDGPLWMVVIPPERCPIAASSCTAGKPRTPSSPTRSAMATRWMCMPDPFLAVHRSSNCCAITHRRRCR